MSEFIAQLVELGIVSDAERFRNFLKDQHLVLEEETVQAVGYEGKNTVVKVTDPELFSCCGCGSWCISSYHGSCPHCGDGRCYDCAMGSDDDSCYNMEENADEDDEEEEE